MATAREAVNSALDFAQKFLDPAQVGGLLLEEIDSAGKFGDKEPVWVITHSMPEPPPPASESGPSVRLLGVFGNPRIYKTFAVSKETNEVLAMKIRELAGNP